MIIRGQISSNPVSEDNQNASDYYNRCPWEYAVQDIAYYPKLYELKARNLQTPGTIRHIPLPLASLGLSTPSYKIFHSIWSSTEPVEPPPMPHTTFCSTIICVVYEHSILKVTKKVSANVAMRLRVIRAWKYRRSYENIGMVGLNVFINYWTLEAAFDTHLASRFWIDKFMGGGGLNLPENFVQVTTDNNVLKSVTESFEDN